MNEQAIEICGTSNPIGSVIWLHGLGADGNDFAPVVEMLNLPELRFILPHAPFRKVTINGDYEMRAWYDLFGLTLGSPEDVAGIAETQRNIEQLIQAELDKGMPSHQMVIAGFSQGGAIALHTALRYQQPLAGVIALSTYLPLQSHFPAQKSPQNQQTPILMAHGTADDVIRIETSRVSLSLLEAEHYPVEWHEYDMAHSLSIEEINDIRAFLLRVMHRDV
ncbi:MAG: dienelactone hydrolase family protein [Methylophilaceae bacterium]|nr:MAG: dienelactone hydrolase family protein [Methylophilaceae bacterium]